MRSPLLLIACWCLLLAGCAKPRDPLVDLQTFFKQVAEGHAQAAYQTSAFGFQSQRTAEAFEKAAQDMGLVGATNVSWEAPQRDGRSVKIHVLVKTNAGQDLPLIVTLLDEGGAWRVFSLRLPPSDQTSPSENRLALGGRAPKLSAAVRQPLPYEPELRTMAREALLSFSDTIAQKSFENFFDSVSLRWQQELIDPEEFQKTQATAVDPDQISPAWRNVTPSEKARGAARLQRAFQPFIDRDFNISAIANMQAEFDVPPEVNSDGLLILSGSYATQPYRVHFKLTYLFEAPNWRLFGLDVDLRK